MSAPVSDVGGGKFRRQQALLRCVCVVRKTATEFASFDWMIESRFNQGLRVVSCGRFRRKVLSTTSRAGYVVGRPSYTLATIE